MSHSDTSLVMSSLVSLSFFSSLFSFLFSTFLCTPCPSSHILHGCTHTSLSPCLTGSLEKRFSYQSTQYTAVHTINTCSLCYCCVYVLRSGGSFSFYVLFLYPIYGHTDLFLIPTIPVHYPRCKLIYKIKNWLCFCC